MWRSPFQFVPKTQSCYRLKTKPQEEAKYCGLNPNLHSTNEVEPPHPLPPPTVSRKAILEVGSLEGAVRDIVPGCSGRGKPLISPPKISNSILGPNVLFFLKNSNWELSSKTNAPFLKFQLMYPRESPTVAFCQNLPPQLKKKSSPTKNWNAHPELPLLVTWDWEYP